MIRNCRLHAAALTLLASIFLFGPSARAQETTPPTTQPTPTPQATPDSQTVKLRLLAFDEKGRAVDLKRENVHVYVDGAEQHVNYFTVEVSPASYGLVVDNSGSLRSQIAAVAAAAQSLAENNGPSDETFIVRFVSSDNIKMLQEMTSDKAALSRALNGMFVQGGQTALLDAVYLAGDYLTKKAAPGTDDERRHALVLITDGEDRASFYKAEQVLNILRGGDTQVFAIGLIGALERSGGFMTTDKRGRSKELLEKLTKDTGGRVFYAETVGELKEAIAEIEKSMHAQYVVGYNPPAPDNKKHKVEVKAFGANGTDKLKVVIRPEHGAPASEEKKEAKKD